VGQSREDLIELAFDPSPAADGLQHLPESLP
jgi:hypothetical protein